jgi:hypothetical protein
MSSSVPSILILPESRQLDDNWPDWKDVVFNLVRGRGYQGYLDGTVVRPTATAVVAAGATPVNSVFPSPEEFDLRDGYVSVLLYQNIKDPKAHGLNPADSARTMWAALHGKFNRTSETLVGHEMEKLRGLKLASGRDLPAHLEALTKQRSEVIRVGGHIPDNQMIPIILQSLPAKEFAASMISLQKLAHVHLVVAQLRQWWDIVWKAKVEAGGVVNALATNVYNAMHCTNCTMDGHTKERCFARGGGKEGQGPYKMACTRRT